MTDAVTMSPRKLAVLLCLAFAEGHQVGMRDNTESTCVLYSDLNVVYALKRPNQAFKFDCSCARSTIAMFQVRQQMFVTLCHIAGCISMCT